MSQPLRCLPQVIRTSFIGSFSDRISLPYRSPYLSGHIGVFPFTLIFAKGACLFRTSRKKDFHIAHISFGFLVMSFIASKFLDFNSSRNTILSNGLSLQISIVSGSFFIFGILMLLLTKASS